MSAAVLKSDIEAKLANRIPAALSPIAQPFPRLHPTGNASLDQLLDGGFPLGSLCEVTGPECSGRSSIALALLAYASREGVCAYVDVSDTCSPHSAAAAGVALRNFLWVRFTSPAASNASSASLDVSRHNDNIREVQQSRQQHCIGVHPRTETQGLAPALEQMMLQKEERRKRKMEGTPGYPNQGLGLSQASGDQVEWEQFNSRKVDDRDPLRQLDKAAAEAARQRSSVFASATASSGAQKKPRSLLDLALRATDQVLQTGGFRVVVLDIASLLPIQTQRIQPSTWWRFQKAAKHSDAIFLILSQTPCARSSASCVIDCSAGDLPRINGVLSSAQHNAQVHRQRTGPTLGKKAPGRVTTLHSAPAWMRSVGR